MVHERFLPKGRKGEPIDVIAYEIDMWRRSAEAVGSKRTAYDQTKSPDDLYEYNLRIEGFLLHTRNLLAFFTDQHNKPTDLTIRQEWVKSQLREQVCSSLIVLAKKLEDNRGEGAGVTTKYQSSSVTAPISGMFAKRGGTLRNCTQIWTRY